MKLYAHYDIVGNIRSVVTMDGPDSAGVMLTPNPGLSVTEVEAEPMKLGPDDVEAARKFGATYKVNTRSRAKLEKKG